MTEARYTTLVFALQDAVDGVLLPVVLKDRFTSEELTAGLVRMGRDYNAVPYGEFGDDRMRFRMGRRMDVLRKLVLG